MARSGLVLFVSLLPGMACSAGGSGAATPDAGVTSDGPSVHHDGPTVTADGPGEDSPGTTLFHLTIAAGHSYCEPDPYCMGRPTTVGFKDAAGRALDTQGPSCSQTTCTECRPYGNCKAGACPGTANAITESTTSWNGRIFQAAVCGAGIGCLEQHYAPPGKYIAVACATPGELVVPDAGPRSCASSGARACVEVPFDFPAAAPVEIVLGGTDLLPCGGTTCAPGEYCVHECSCGGPAPRCEPMVDGGQCPGAPCQLQGGGIGCGPPACQNPPPRCTSSLATCAGAVGSHPRNRDVTCSCPP